MPRPSIKRMIDLSDRISKQKLMVEIGAMQGQYEVEIEPRRVTRSNAQNAYYWGVVVEAVRLGIDEAWGENLSAEQVHDLLRKKFLELPIVNRKTGEVVEVIPGSTRALSTVEFCAYLDQVIKFAGEFLNVEVPPADPEWWRNEQKESVKDRNDEPVNKEFVF